MAALRLSIAIVMAFCLTFAPLTAVQAAKAAHASVAEVQTDMPDCHKAKLHHGMPCDRGCCDHHSKSKCPDDACGCALSGAQTLGVAVFTVQKPFRLASTGKFHMPDAARPPGLRLHPHGPPPRN